jgi:hypothetical protein
MYSKMDSIKGDVNMLKNTKVVELRFSGEDESFSLWEVESVDEFEKIVDEFNKAWDKGDCDGFGFDWLEANGYRGKFKELTIDKRIFK